jgi:pyridoxal phosphate enzyme (YggS family)
MGSGVPARRDKSPDHVALAKVMSRLLTNLANVRQRIADAARRSGRSPADITLVAVTKYVGDEVIAELVTAGCLELGESRPQALRAKAGAIAERIGEKGASPPTVRWHLVGHLQRNKVEQTLPLVSLIHSADSLRLLKAIDEAALGQDRFVDALIEVNISGDAAKHGFAHAEVLPALPAIAALEHVRVRGMMCMAAREGDAEIARRNFAAVRELRDQLAADKPDNVHLEALSMGMSGDYEIAIEEGATIVRIGSALFEGL